MRYTPILLAFHQTLCFHRFSFEIRVSDNVKVDSYILELTLQTQSNTGPMCSILSRKTVDLIDIHLVGLVCI